MVWLDVFVPIANVAKEWILRDPGVTAAVVSSFTASSAGLLPRVGPLRALTLAFRSKVRGANPISQRAVDVSTLLSKLEALKKDQYIVVTGAKGIGKSCVVETATRYTCGVVRVDISSGASSDNIVQKTLMEITNIRLPFLNIHPSSRRVLFWYRLFAKPPIVIFRVAERMDNDKYAQVPSAARQLAGLGLRVLIDGSTNSLPIETLNTRRQVVIDLDPMSEKVLESIPECQPLLEELKKNGLYEVVWAIVGGVPADFQNLDTEWEINKFSDIDTVAYEYLRNLISKAISKCSRMLSEYPEMSNILDLFKTESEVLETIIKRKQIVRPSPDKVLRTVFRDGNAVLIPVDAAMAFVLRNQLETTPSLEEMKKIVSQNNSA